MIKDLEKKTSNDKYGKAREYYRFSVVGDILGFTAEIRGWRYWPESRDVKPPLLPFGKKQFWIVKGIEGGLIEAVQKAVEKRIGCDETYRQTPAKDDTISKLVDETPQVDYDSEWQQLGSQGFKRQYPGRFREMFLKDLSHSDPDSLRLFDNLPGGRLWPDEVLVFTARDLVAGRKEFKEHQQDLDNGIFSEEDNKVVAEMIDRIAGGVE